MQNTALILIDMQHGMQTWRPAYRNNPGAEAQMAALLHAWRGAGLPVVHVRHISRDPTSVFAPGQPGAAFQPAFAPLPLEHVVEKNVPDAFIQSGLERWLHVRAIRDVVIVGVATNNSVESTARSAGNLGLIATVVADATYAYAQADYAGVERSAEDVHSMSLSNLNGEYATVRSSADVLRALKQG
ncbi:cysteine hydrolase family protein [Massilia sp. S19_KUP03_FR1]|uniref:cysteine hydrolase family protein n=1 Tax=Massilia sp. S19_KUP03_FR1 TaxID=3025503 RepID=UPI002FCDC1ED